MKKMLYAAFAAMILTACTATAEQDPVEAQIDSIISRMSTREKVAQLFMIGVHQDEGLLHWQERCVETEHVGGIIVMGHPLEKALDRIDTLQALATSRQGSLPLLVATDAEWGASMRFKEFPKWPRQAFIADAPDSLIYQMGLSVAAELKSIGIHINFAPVVDVNNNPNNPVIGRRSFGADKNIVAQKAAAYSAGMLDGGIITCAKHFPGHGDTEVDSHKGLPVLEFDRARLDSLELYPFRKMIQAGVPMIMTGHLSVPALDESGAPVSVSEKAIKGVLRGELGFEGVIVTDGLGMNGVYKWCGEDSTKVAVAAYKAGNDMLLMPRSCTCALDEITSGIKTRSDRADLDARVRRVLRLKARMGLLDGEPYKKIDRSLIDLSAADKLKEKMWRFAPEQ
ncbi:MAG: hypothetical protein MJY62_04080 [Bacteroidales bacterium]|nr:hypothetical protein [Bacteroidales bacterium]